MTPAERASAVAFAAHNCALENLHPSQGMLELAREHMRGDADSAALLSYAQEDEPSNRRADEIFARTVALAEHGWRATGDLAELRAIHLALYTDVFEDAGVLRSGDTLRSQTTERTGQSLFPAHLIETGAANICTQLAEEHHLSGLDRDVFVHHLAVIYDELGFLHPFEGGNAAVLRIFASRLAHRAGWDLDWGLVTHDEYQQARSLAYSGDISGLERMFARIVRPANPSRVFLIAGWDQGPAH